MLNNFTLWQSHMQEQEGKIDKEVVASVEDISPWYQLLKSSWHLDQSIETKEEIVLNFRNFNSYLL